jgi:hypothetical protein
LREASGLIPHKRNPANNFSQRGASISEAPPGSLPSRRPISGSSTGTRGEFIWRRTSRCDAIVISEAPNDEVVTRFAIVTGSLGNVRTETLRAFTEDEYRKIISALP